MNDQSNKSSKLITLGWREWLGLPDLGIPAIKAKIDTGARSSCIHAASVETFWRKRKHMARFVVHPLRKRPQVQFECEAEITDQRKVSDSGGHKEARYFIRTTVELGGKSFPLELNLTDRENMLFPMLLGRTAMQGRFAVDPSLSFAAGKPDARFYRSDSS